MPADVYEKMMKDMHVHVIFFLAAATMFWRLKRALRPTGAPLVGILGGLGPMASALLARLIVEEAEKAGACDDNEHTRFIMFQDPTLPNSRKAALGKGPSPYDGSGLGCDSNRNYSTT
jgi:hypothetical protein